MSSTRLHPVKAGSVTIWAVVGLVCGWLVRRVGEWINGTAPVISWFQPLVVALVAAIMAGTAYLTWRQVQVRGERLESNRAVNRLVLGRACAYVGALLAGGYFGYAVSWMGLDGDALAHTVLWRVRSCARRAYGSSVRVASAKTTTPVSN